MGLFQSIPFWLTIVSLSVMLVDHTASFWAHLKKVFPGQKPEQKEYSDCDYCVDIDRYQPVSFRNYWHAVLTL